MFEEETNSQNPNLSSAIQANLQLDNVPIQIAEMRQKVVAIREIYPKKGISEIFHSILKFHV